MKIIYKIGIGFTIGCAATLTVNHLINDKEISNSHESYVRRADFFGYTEFQRLIPGESKYRREEFYIAPVVDIVTQSIPFAKITLYDGLDGKCDGQVDIIETELLGDRSFAQRSEYYEQLKNEFDEADKLLAKTKERFKELIKTDYV